MCIDERISNVDVCEVSEGIEVRVVSIFLVDENEVDIILTLRDTTGADRINKYSVFEKCVVENDNHEGDGRGSYGPIEFDEETKTDIHLITQRSTVGIGNTKLVLNGLIENTFNCVKENVLEDIDIYKLAMNKTETMKQTEMKHGRGVYTGNVDYETFEKMDFLIIDRTNIQFNSIDWAVITNVGFVDGVLHIQIKSLSNGRSGGFSSKDFSSLTIENNGIVYEHDGTLSFYKENEFDRQSNIGYEYKEYVYNGITDVSQLKDNKVTITYMDMGKTVPVSCEFEFGKPVIASKVVGDVDDLVAETDVIASEILLSPVGVHISVESTEDMELKYEDIKEVCVVYNNGEIKKLDSHGGGSSAENGIVSSRFFYMAMEPIGIVIDEVREIVINGKVFGV